MIALNINLKECIIRFLSWNFFGTLLSFALNQLLNNTVYKINSIIIIFTILNLHFLIWMINTKVNHINSIHKKIYIISAIFLSLMVSIYYAFLPLATYSYIAHKDHNISIIKFNSSYKSLSNLTENNCSRELCILPVSKLQLYPTHGNYVNIEINTSLNHLTIRSVSIQKIQLLNNQMILE